MFTILLFLLEVDILMQARHTGRKAGLCWLPLIFAVWANTHIQFVYGLFVLGLVFAETIASRWTKNAERGVGPLWMGLALAASVLGSLLNPYGWRLYAVAHDLAIQSGALNKITELQSIPFRSAPDFMVLFLALSGAGALGWRRKLLSFEGVLFAFAVWLSFRSQRDVWITAIVTAILLANSIRTNRKSAEVTSAAGYTGACVLAICFLFAGFKLLRVNNEALQVQIDETFPVNAVQKLATYRLSGPVYSDFNWGGYLIWHLRNPVVMDGRQNVYGDKRMDRSVETWAGGPDWSNDPELASAMAVVGPVKSPLIQLLRTDHRFRKVYEDNTAAVFLPNR
jgi:hypothetical protein